MEDVSSHQVSLDWWREVISICADPDCTNQIHRNDDYVEITQRHDGRIGLGPLLFCSWSCAMLTCYEGCIDEVAANQHGR